MSLSLRITQLEAKQPPRQGELHQVWANSSAEASARVDEMKASGEIGPDDDVLCWIIVGPGDNHMNEPMISVVED